MKEEKPKVYISKSGDKFRVINCGVPIGGAIGEDKPSAALALYAVLNSGLEVSNKMWDDDTKTWVDLTALKTIINLL